MKLEDIDKLLGEITQGEWWIDPDGPKYSVNYKGPLDTFRHIAMVSCCIHRQGDKEENEANARLIAAAPTIIRELVERVRVLENVATRARQLGNTVGNPFVPNAMLHAALPRLIDNLQAELEGLDAKEQDDD